MSNLKDGSPAIPRRSPLSGGITESHEARSPPADLESEYSFSPGARRPSRHRAGSRPTHRRVPSEKRRLQAGRGTSRRPRHQREKVEGHSGARGSKVAVKKNKDKKAQAYCLPSSALKIPPKNFPMPRMTLPIPFPVAVTPSSIA